EVRGSPAEASGMSASCHTERMNVALLGFLQSSLYGRPEMQVGRERGLVAEYAQARVRSQGFASRCIVRCNAGAKRPSAACEYETNASKLIAGLRDARLLAE